MKACPAIIAALPREVAGLVKGWDKRELPGNVVVYTNARALVACGGMGVARAELAVQAAMSEMPITALISVGLAGACDPELRVGDIVRAGVVIDSRTGERFDDSRYRQVLVTADAVASVREKARLFVEYDAEAVDMEASAVARLAKVHGLGFHAIKAISDEVDFELEGLSRFATEDGQFREIAFALHAAVRPAMWSKIVALGRNSGKALSALTATLEAELDWYEQREDFPTEEKNVD
jgi:adenosylhomocysteine nucleosidase